MVARGIASRAKIERLILAAGHVGISRTKVREAVKMARSAVARHCIALEMSGRVEKTADTGLHVRWGAPGIRAAHAKTRKPKKTDPQRWQDTKDAALWANVWTEQMPTHLCVSANDVPPLGKPGIASVWELAA